MKNDALQEKFITLRKEKTYFKCSCNVGSGADCPLHWHEGYEICQVLSGKVRFLVDGVYYDLEEGDILCINACIPHLNYGGKGVALRVLRILPSVLLQISADPKPLKMLISKSELDAVAGLTDTLNGLLTKLTELPNLPVESSAPLQQALSSALYFLLMEHFPAENGDHKSKSKERKVFFAVLDYVNAHFTEEINVNVISQKLYYPRGKLSEIFLKYSGSRLSDYIGTLRVQRVNKLLGEGCSITDAALSSGFQNIRSFNNVYKAHMGFTPSEFIRKNS